MARERYHNMDLLKFFAIIFVVIYHSCYVNMNFGGSVAGFFNYIFRPFISAGVPVFFFVNGFLLIDKRFDLKKHLNKTFKLAAITFIWGFINIVALMPLKNQYLPVKTVLSYLWSWKAGWINHFWFMGALVCIYLFYPLVKTAFDNNRKIFNYVVVLCVVLVFGNILLGMISTVYHYILGDGTGFVRTNFFNMFNPLKGVSYVFSIPYFLAGCYFGGNKEVIKERIEKSFLRSDLLKGVLLISSVVGLGFWSIFLVKQGVSWDIVWNGYSTVFTLINVVLIYLLSMRYKYNPKNPVCRFIGYISCNTLSIFFIHKIICTAFENTGLVQLPFMMNYLTNFIYASVVAVICVAIASILKRIPVLKNLV